MNGSNARLRTASRAAFLALCAVAVVAAGRASAGANTSFSGTAYVDYWGMSSKAMAKRSPSGVTIDAMVKLGVDVNDDLTFSAKACFSCHGIEFDNVMLDWMPSTRFNVQVGRVAVPFGEFSNRVDPSGHKTVSAPLIYDMGRMVFGEKSAMNLGVVPLPYSDTGVMVYGQFFLLEAIQVWYGAYGMAGFRGSNDLDWVATRSIYYTDNNRVPSGGGRVAVTYASEGGGLIGDVSVGASVTGGRYDRDAQLAYLAWGADAVMQLGKATLRAEYATRQTDLNPAASYPYTVVDPWITKEGWYGEVEFPVPGLARWVSAALRYDELRRRGTPLSSSSTISPDSTIQRYTAGLFIIPAPSLYLKLGYEYWAATDFAALHAAHLGFGGSF
ncbi:MAG TPA: hypothetical protein VLT61_16980 [Anaeromyxobacteraceae bacterium]|nr:hypothetical protein [Anaeromyxobacteraceae bacterium]